MADEPPTPIRRLVEASVSARPKPMRSIYRFVLGFRPGVAEETIRARVYEAVQRGVIRRLAPGVYFARSGPATLLLVQGDARDVLSKWDSDSLDAVITDPPYDLGTRQHALTGTTRPHRGQGRSYEQRDLDTETLREVFRVLRKGREWNTIHGGKQATARYPRGGGAFLIFAPPITRSTWPHIRGLIDLAEQLGFVFYGSITWDHEIKGMGYDCGRNQKNELLLFTAGPRGGLLWDLGFPNVLRHRRLSRRTGEHEAEKPTSLWMHLLRALTREGDVVADFFAGRGRWIPQALREGRHVVAVERDGKWVGRICADFSQARIG